MKRPSKRLRRNAAKTSRAGRPSKPGGQAASSAREATRTINQRIFDTSLDLILVVDRHGTFLRVSPSAMPILGHLPEEMIGRSAINFIFEDDLEKTREEMRLARRRLVTRNFDCRYVHKAGRPVSLNWTGVWLEAYNQHFFIGRDMTDSLKLEAQLRHAQKMESIGRLTGGIAHDFNNLLTVIAGTSELLAETTSDPQLQAMAKRINEAADHGAQLTHRMLAFARKQPLQSRNVDLNEIVSQTAAPLQRMLGDDISLRCVLTEGAWPAVADPSQVEDALLNLAVNARDAMPRGGQLVIETANVDLDEQYAAQNPEVVPGPYSAITISDSGSGMPAEVIERAFEPFFTTKEVGRGTGLGLSMIYGFMKQSRGHIKIYSEVGHGTSIKLYFPRGSGLQTSMPVVSVESGLLHNGTILVVEDSAAVRSVAREILQSLGYDVIEAEDGLAALAVLRGGQPIDLLFTDMIMPKNMTGAELLREARKLMPQLRAVLTSGYSEHLIAELDEDNANVPLLGKPYGKQQLAAAVRKALQVVCVPKT